MNAAVNVSARDLNVALEEVPSLTLSFYSYGVILRKCEGDAVAEYPVDPAQVAVALAAKVTFDTGLLGSDTLLVRQEGVKKIAIGFRPAQKTGVYLDGAETPVRIPLPPLVLFRITTENRNPQYQVYALKRRPNVLEEPLYHAPLPNVFPSASICWGSVQRIADSALESSSLAPDWNMLLGSAFGDHAVSGKSKHYPQDIRQQFIDLEARKARVYPKRDLIPVKQTLGQVLEALS